MLMTHTHAKINIRALQFKKLEWKQIDGITFLANVLGKYGTHTHINLTATCPGLPG